MSSVFHSRHSVRAFRPTPVSQGLIEQVLEAASWAPSGTNTQPWQVYVLQGASLQQLIEQVCTAHDVQRDNRSQNAPQNASQKGPYEEPPAYYPTTWPAPYADRRKATGIGLYHLLGIAKGDAPAMHHQEQQNYRFFGAPVGLFFTLDRALGHGSFLDYGMFLQNLMLAATERGLSTCAQASWNHFAKLVLTHIEASPQERLVCGMALGYADERHLINTFHTPRLPVDQFTKWMI
jgi:nitroreductase